MLISMARDSRVESKRHAAPMPVTISPISAVLTKRAFILLASIKNTQPYDRRTLVGFGTSQCGVWLARKHFVWWYYWYIFSCKKQEMFVLQFAGNPNCVSDLFSNILKSIEKLSKIFGMGPPKSLIRRCMNGYSCGLCSCCVHSIGLACVGIR